MADSDRTEVSPSRDGAPARPNLDVVPDVEEGTVTFTPMPADEVETDPTRWISVAVEDLVDVRDVR
jgi:hypothetical protein